jgi:hypothetical protein
VPLADWNRRAQILQHLRGSDGKYAAPFDKGKLKSFSLLGGTWDGYAAIVVQMVIADTLLEMEKMMREDRVVRPDLPHPPA